MKIILTNGESRKNGGTCRGGSPRQPLTNELAIDAGAGTEARPYRFIESSSFTAPVNANERSLAAERQRWPECGR